MEGLNLDDILDPQQFQEVLDIEDSDTGKKKKEDDIKVSSEEENNTVEIDGDNLFDDNQKSESVDSEKNSEKGEEAPESGDAGTPNKLYSSIATALRDEGVFPDLSDDNLKDIKEAGDFRKLIEEQVNNMLDEKQKRIDAALNSGAQPDEITQYENTMDFLDKISEDQLSEESKEAENLRKQLIYKDFINRGYSEERAKKEVKKSLDTGNEIEDALDALQSNKDFYQESYNKYMQTLKDKQKAQQEEQDRYVETLKKDIVDNDEFFGGVNVDKNTRQNAYEALTKPVYKDSESGQYMTALQKYQKEHSSEFMKNVGMLYTLTDGFKNVDKLVNTRVKKEVRRGFKELEHTLNNTARNSDGTLNFASGEDYDSEYIGKGIKLDI